MEELSKVQIISYLNNLRCNECANKLNEFLYPKIKRHLIHHCGYNVPVWDILQVFYSKILAKGVPTNIRLPLAWIKRSCLNVYRDMLRADKRLVVGLPIEVEDRPVEKPDRHIVNKTLLRMLRQLDECDRSIIFARFWDELSIREIAKELGLTQVEVKKRLDNAIAFLRSIAPREEFGLSSKENSINQLGDESSQDTQEDHSEKPNEALEEAP